MTRNEDPIVVLFVDDEPNLPELVARKLEQVDDRLSVLTADSVERGVAILAERDVDCIVADYALPEQNGLDFLETVRADHPRLPFILYTGRGSEGVASDAISKGVTDYFRKGKVPNQYEILANRIANAVEAFRSRQALEERTKELETAERLVHSMLASACIYDRDHRFVLVNEYLADWYGKPRAELEGEKSNLIPLIQGQYNDDPFAKLFDGELEKLTGTVEGDFPGHGHAVLEYKLSSLRIGGAVEGIVGVTKDVTERAERDRELERAFEEYQELFDGMNDTAWVIGSDGEFLAVNDAAVETLGYSREELLSMDPHDIDDLLEPERIDSLIENMPEDGTQVFETVHRATDGTTIPVEISSSLITYRDEPAILSVARDISSRKEREKRLEQFASVVSHDLRNPLNVAQGRLELARESCESEHLGAIEQAHDRMQTLIEDLLALARQGGPVTETEPVDLDAIVEESWQNVETDRAEIHVDGGRTLEADASRLRQVLENLFRNAVEHDGTDVAVTVGVLEDGFFVEDDGGGIPEAIREDIFEAGFSTDEEGTGFGLSIVERIVEAHDWDVRLRESDAGGTRFEITGVDFVEE